MAEQKKVSQPRQKKDTKSMQKFFLVLWAIFVGIVIPFYNQYEGNISLSHLENTIATAESHESQQSSPATAGTQRSSAVAAPILDGAEILIPGAVAVNGIHKLMMHKDTAGSLVIEMLTRGGGSVLAVELMKQMVN